MLVVLDIHCLHLTTAHAMELVAAASSWHVLLLALLAHGPAVQHAMLYANSF
jgi:hypothetical protein